RLNQPTIAGFGFGCPSTGSIHASAGHAAVAARNVRRVEWRLACGRTGRGEPATFPTPSSPYRRHYMPPVLAGPVPLLQHKCEIFTLHCSCSPIPLNLLFTVSWEGTCNGCGHES